MIAFLSILCLQDIAERLEPGRLQLEDHLSADATLPAAQDTNGSIVAESVGTSEEIRPVGQQDEGQEQEPIPQLEDLELKDDGLFSRLKDIKFSIHPEYTRVLRTKFRIRDGEPSLKGTSLFSRDLDADHADRAGGWISAAIGRERFTLGFWSFTSSGTGVLPEDKNFGGSVHPAGAIVDYDILYQHVELGYRHRFDLVRDSLLLDAGLDIEYLVFDADLGLGRTRLHGIYPTPQFTLTVQPMDDIEVFTSVGGFFLSTVKAEMAVTEPWEGGGGLRIHWGAFTAEIGFTMVHVHLEENMGDIDEDVVHMRQRNLHVSIGYKF